jgi:hypothetical protein
MSKTKEIANLLNGRMRGNEVTKQERIDFKKSGIIVIYGYSDDGIILTGAFDNGVCAFDGTEFYINKDGVLERSCDECEDCYRYKKDYEQSKKITAIWHDLVYPCWTFRTDVPHETFDIISISKEIFCKGIVININDL